MTRLLLKMLFRGTGHRVNMPVMGVVVLLSFGVGLFWCVQILLSNYLDGLTESVLDVKEEIAVMRNPLHARQNAGAASPDAKPEDDLTSRMRLNAMEYTEVLEQLSRFNGLVAVPVIKQADFPVHKRDENIQSIFSVLLLGLQPSTGIAVFPVFEQLDETAIREFGQTDGDVHPLIISEGLMPGVARGDVCELEMGRSVWRFRIVGLLRQDGIFSVPLLIVPLPVAQRLVGRDSADFVAVRVPGGGSLEQSEMLDKYFDAELDGKYIVQHWSEALKVIYAVFNSINLVISAIVSSLFIIAFFFSIALIDIVLKRRRKNIAMLLALGMQPGKIRNMVILFGFLLGMGGFIGGVVLCRGFLAILPELPLADKLASVFITDFSFTFSWQTALIALTLSLATSVLSAWLSGRRVFRIDPIEDIRV